ncbi:hypothetical protein [Dongia sp.]|uniref:hypothetical protein n=1 Tax=Dongia sp. TaxID=1977262 RepID=UPI0035B316B9
MAILSVAVVATVALGTLVSAIILMLARETTPPETAAQLQERHGGLYGPATDDGVFVYKLARYTLHQPDILVVGSRRLAALPGEAFSGSVYNAAGAANSLAQLITFTRSAVAAHSPKSILIGLDYWWFNPDLPPAPAPATSSPGYMKQLFDPFQWLVTGRVSPRAMLAVLLPSNSEARGIGAFAVLNGEGWDAYGRYDNAMHPGGGGDMPAGIEDVHVGPSSESVAQLGALVAELNGGSIEVILMLPPMASPMRGALAQDPENRLVPLSNDAIRSLGQRVFDFQDATALGATDCEFTSDIAGGEVAYLRTLDAIGNFGGTYLSQAIDRDMVTSLIGSNSGHVRVAELLPADAAHDALFRHDSCDKDR